MRIAGTYSATTALAIMAMASLGACAKHETPPLAELPPSTPAAPASPTSTAPASPTLNAPPPRQPSEDEQAQGELAAIGAIQTVRGWTLPIAHAKFTAGRFSLGQGDQRIDEVAKALKNRPRLRVLIAAHVDHQGSNRRARRISQLHANEVLRALTAKGVDAAQIQAQGRANAFSDLPGDPGVLLIFSNAEGEFSSAAVAP